MHPEDIKAELRKKGLTLAFIARELGVAPTTVSQVIRGRSTSVRIERAISQRLELPVEAVFKKSEI